MLKKTLLGFTSQCICSWDAETNIDMQPDSQWQTRINTNGCFCWFWAVRLNNWTSWGHSGPLVWKCLNFISLSFCGIIMTFDPSNQVISSSSPSGHLFKMWRKSLTVSLRQEQDGHHVSDRGTRIPGSLFSSGSAPTVNEVYSGLRLILQLSLMEICWVVFV